MSLATVWNVDNEYDAVVVGGRCAGAATAMLLARNGWRVALLDRSHVVRDTLSTHALMHAGVLQLHRWGVLDRIVDAGTPAIRHTMFHYGDDSIRVPVVAVGEIDALYAPRRTVLDPVLVDAAIESDVDAMFGVSVEGVERAADGRVVGVRGLTNESVRRPFRLRARVTIGADGIHSTIARSVGASIVRQATHASASVYTYVDGLDVTGYEWFFRTGVCAGLIPTNDGATCVFASVPRARFRAEVMFDTLSAWRRLLAEASPSMAERVVSSGAPGPFRSWSGLGGYLRSPCGPGWALVGDASYYKDPISAHGISDALRDAEMLADAVDAVFRGEMSENEAMRHYHFTRNRLSSRLFARTDAVASFQWDDDSIERHVRALTASMADEVDYLLALDNAPCTRLAV